MIHGASRHNLLIFHTLLYQRRPSSIKLANSLKYSAKFTLHSRRKPQNGKNRIRFRGSVTAWRSASSFAFRLLNVSTIRLNLLSSISSMCCAGKYWWRVQGVEPVLSRAYETRMNRFTPPPCCAIRVALLPPAWDSNPHRQTLAQRVFHFSADT